MFFKVVIEEGKGRQVCLKYWQTSYNAIESVWKVFVNLWNTKGGLNACTKVLDNLP